MKPATYVVSWHNKQTNIHTYITTEIITPMSLGECLGTPDPPQTVAHADPEGARALHAHEILLRNALDSFSQKAINGFIFLWIF